MFGFLTRKKLDLPDPAEALPGRAEPIVSPGEHRVLHRPMTPPWPEGARTVLLGMGCFWGAERKYWQTEGVWVTAVGYAGGVTPNPTYEEVCSGGTGHAEVVLVVYRPEQVSLERLLQAFWEGHDPTQGMRQGNDVGTQYRSCIYLDDAEDRAVAEASRAAYQAELDKAGHGRITTEIAGHQPFYYAEAAHQQYLARNPMGYCGLGGTGVSCPVGIKLDAVSA